MIFCAPPLLSRYRCAPKICAPNAHLNTVSFYDALGNRIGMDENGTQTWTLYDSGNPIMDFNSSGSLTMRYLWGPTGIVARQTSGGTVSWYLADALGTVRDLINNSGAVIDHVDFSAFGTVLDESSPTNGDRMTGFEGLERDTVTGLNLAVFREENAGTGRWDSQDPLGYGGEDSNLYRYAVNMPTGALDSSGLQAVRLAPDGHRIGWLADSTGWDPWQPQMYPVGTKPPEGPFPLAARSQSRLCGKHGGQRSRCDGQPDGQRGVPVTVGRAVKKIGATAGRRRYVCLLPPGHWGFLLHVPEACPRIEWLHHSVQRTEDT